MTTPWRKVPESWGTNPYNLQPTDLGLLLIMSLWSGSNETDGVLTHAQALACCQITKVTTRNESRHLRRMVRRGALAKLEDGGYRIVDYCDTTREERLAGRQREAEKKRRQRSRSKGFQVQVTPDRRRFDDASPGGHRPFVVQNQPKPDELSPPSRAEQRSATQSSAPRNNVGAGMALERQPPPGPPQTPSGVAASSGEDGQRTWEEHHELGRQKVREAVGRIWQPGEREQLKAQIPRYLANVAARNPEAVVKCPHCEASVGASAKRCWSCGGTWP